MSRVSLSLFSLIAAALVTFTAGCGEQTEGYVYIDNGSESTMYVRVDGKKVGKVRPGQFEKFTLDLGERSIRIMSDGEVIYDRKHTLDYGDRPFRRPMYLLNPDNSNRYVRASVVYGEQSSGRSLQELINLVSRTNGPEPDVNDDEAVREAWELDRQTKRQYKEIKRGFHAFEGKPFVQFESVSYFLTSLPNSVMGSRYSRTERRSAIFRVPQKVHALLEATDVQEPNGQDFERLLLADELVQALIPFQSH